MGSYQIWSYHLTNGKNLSFLCLKSYFTLNFRKLKVLHGLVLLINMQKLHFKHFVKTVEATYLKFGTILKLVTLHLEQTIAQVKCTN